MAVCRNFREVSLHSGRKEGNVINFKIGSTTTVRDEDHAKLHTGGGYAYRESGNVDSVTRNRFIFWFVCTANLSFLFCVFKVHITLGNWPVILLLLFLIQYQLSWVSLELKIVQQTLMFVEHF